MGLSLFIIFLTTVICLLFYFRRKFQQEKRKHLVHVSTLIEAYDLQKSQIQNRQKNLNTYDFLARNLKEALQAQPEILLEC